jgi:hypothetical protein
VRADHQAIRDVLRSAYQQYEAVLPPEVVPVAIPPYAHRQTPARGDAGGVAARIGGMLSIRPPSARLDGERTGTVPVLASRRNRPMKQYLLSVYQPEGPAPAPEALETISRDLDALNQEMKAAGSWVFAGGLFPPSTATVVRVRDGEMITTDRPFA